MSRLVQAATAAAFACVLSLASLPAQSLREGHGDGLQSLPANASNVLVMPSPAGDSLVWFTGSDLVLSSPGAAPVVLNHWSTPTFGGVTLDAGNGSVLFADAGNGDLWSIPLQPGLPAHVLANLPLLYDAVLLSPSRVVVSARVGGYGAQDNDLVVVELATGAMQALARVAGASGPVLVDAQGDLLYATASLTYPSPPASVSLLRFPRAAVDAALLGNFLLGSSNAVTVLSGLDSVADLTIDGEGDVFFVDWMRSELSEVRHAGSAQPMQQVLLSYGSAAATAASLQFVASGTAQFEPFQPAGPRLCVQETDYVNTNQLRTITPRRPTNVVSGATPVPAGPFAITLEHGPAGGLAMIAIHTASNGSEAPWLVPGFAQVLWWDPAMTSALAVQFVLCDGHGHGVLNLVNPGIPGGFVAFAQTAVLDAQQTVLGSCAVVNVPLGQ